MTSGSVLVKILILYFAINIMLFAGGISVSGVLSGSVYPQILSNTNNSEITQENPTNGYGLGTAKANLTVNVDEQTGGTGTFLSFIDVLRATRGFVNFILSMFLNVFVMWFLFPPAVQLFVGVPFALLSFVGIIYFVRSGQ